MLKNETILEIVKNERVYRLYLSPDSPLGECFDVLTEMRSFVHTKVNELMQEVKTDNLPKE